MSRLSNYFRPVLAGVGEQVPWIAPVFGAVALALFGNYLYDVARTYGGFVAAPFVAFLFLAVGSGVIATTTWRQERLRGLPNYAVADKSNPPKHQGLIVLVSSAEVVQKAIEYHLPELKCCWLIVTPAVAIQKIATEVQAKFPSGPVFKVRQIPNEYDTTACLALVGHILSHEAPSQGISRENVIADITGGTKPMTAAAVVACLEGGYAMQHVPAQFKQEGGRLVERVPLDPIQIVIAPVKATDRRQA